MKGLGNIKIGTKLIMGFLLVIGLLITSSVFGYVNLKDVNNGTQQLHDDALVPVEIVGNIDSGMYQLRGDVYKYMAMADERSGTKTAITNDITAINKKLSELTATDMTQTEGEAFAAVNAGWAVYKLEIDKVLGLVDANKMTEAEHLLVSGGSTSNARKALDASMATLIDMQSELADQIKAEAGKTYSKASLITIVLAIIATVLGVFAAIILTRNITGPVNKVKEGLTRVAAGDVSEKLDISSTDEVGVMAKAYGDMQVYLSDMSAIAERIANGDLSADVNPKSEKDKLGVAFSRMIDGLRELIVKVQESASTMASASEQLSSSSEQSGSATNQIASVSQQVAKGAAEQSKGIGQVNDAVKELGQAIEVVSASSTEQANAVERATGIVQQVSSAARQTASSAQEAAANAAQAAEMAKQGSATVEKTIDGIRKINRSMQDTAQKVTELGKHSEEIGGMIAVVGDIAAQTNLLALNAAIEAARAGEQGRGFAVVADEVKKLAERTAKQTKEIASLVQSVQKGVSESIKASTDGARQAEEGSVLANEAGTALHQILDTIHGMTSQIEQISAAAEEMSASAGEMVAVVDNVSKLANQNSAATTQMSVSKNKVSDSTTTVAAAIEQNSAATEQMSASVQEMSAQVEEVVASSKSLSSLAVELEKVSSTFQLNGHGNHSGNGKSQKGKTKKEAVAV